ncbi:hypothetical protein GCM10023156_71790 [Novipirellula rosea]|uniref:Uncharacterized protein n=2 Tax=Novipirellula rosea TaxID=1031540 RepID=A0ABP8NX89_9BACT
MAQVPDFQFTLTEADVNEALAKSRFAHFLAAGQHAPKDGKLFEYRKSVGAVNVPELAMASLLSKKIAVGVATVGLDVRVSKHGNFGTTWEEARANSRRIVKVGRELGINVTCFLSGGSRSYQPFIGRGEALIALDQLVEGDEGSWLLHHAEQCFAMANSIAPSNGTWTQVRKNLGNAFEQHLNAQGTDGHRFKTAVDNVRNQTRVPVLARTEGFAKISLGLLRRVFVETQDAYKSASDPFPDPIGVVLSKNSGDYCRTGEELASVRCCKEHFKLVMESLQKAIKVSAFPGESGFLEEVKHV